MAETEASSKRRRISPSDGIVLRDLPNEALCYVASYLPSPSKALFAIALRCTNDVGGDDDASKASAIILGEQCDVLDFGGLEKSLASKITDDTLRNVLLCIGANSKLKKLVLRI